LAGFIESVLRPSKAVSVPPDAPRASLLPKLRIQTETAQSKSAEENSGTTQMFLPTHCILLPHLCPHSTCEQHRCSTQLTIFHDMVHDWSSTRRQTMSMAEQATRDHYALRHTRTTRRCGSRFCRACRSRTRGHTPDT
jgi:hypothetical protein